MSHAWNNRNGFEAVDTSLHRATPIGPRHELESYLDKCANDEARETPTAWMKCIGTVALMALAAGLVGMAWTVDVGVWK